MSSKKARAIILGAGVLYFAYYIFFTGVIEQTNANASFSPQGNGVFLVTIASEAYSGPGLEIISGSSITLIRLTALAISAVLSAAIALNLLFLLNLYRMGGLRACLRLGGTAGIGAIVANLASFSYLCCGWAVSLVLVGSTALAPLSIYIGIGITVLLLANAVALRKRQLAFSGPRRNNT